MVLYKTGNTNAVLNGTNFTAADLTNARLDGNTAHQANFARANLRASSLRGASLVGADLQGANFSSADLRDADLTDARLEQALFDRARTEGCTGCPVTTDPR